MELNQFKEEVLPVRSKIYSYSLRLLNNLTEAEDAVQEVLLKLWQMRERLEEYRNIEALSIQITKNICLNKLDYQKRHQTDQVDQFYFIAETDSSEKRMEAADAVSLVKKIINSLPDLQKLIIQMRDLEGYELDEIAEITGCRIESVRMNLSRARKRVKEIFFKINHIS
ncbi:MAG: RNA polymerase sigma factor [Bacteroidales bacterium]|jgi:RNA polymerase sigma-70 factor (ECF subfamily)|nr:RNA polymerase sigma factor [Bacteroidales bacterium]